VLAIGPTPPLATGQGYGEDEPSLGQFVDDFTDLGNVSVAVEVVRNITLDVMELNFTVGGGPAYQNFTEYVEVDSDLDITVYDRNVSWDSMRRDAISWVVFDFGVDYFGDFSVDFTLDFSNIEAGDVSNRHIMPIIYFSNTIGTFADTGLGDLLVILPRQVGATDDIYRYDVRQVTGGVLQFTIVDVTDYAMPRHYGTFGRVGNVVTLRIYTDEARTNLIETLSDTGDNTAYRYFHVFGSYDSVGDGGDHSTGVIEDVYFESLPDGYSPIGYFTTTDHFDYVNGSTLVLMTQSRLSPNTHITVQMSDDNATWGDAEGIPGDSHDLLGGLETIDLRPFNGSGPYYVMFNLSTTNPAVTPYLNQSRLITTMGPSPAPGPGGPGQNVTGEWALYNLSSILTLVGTLDSGDLNSTLDVDGDQYSVSEVVGAPGFLISFNWTAVDLDAHCLWIVINAWYDGNLAHDVDVELYNHTALAWVDLGHILDGVGFEWFNASIYSLRIPMDFLNGAGEVWGRLNHVSAGNINHDLLIEYLKLHAFIPNGVTPTVTTARVVDVTPFIAIGLILALAMYLLADRIRN
jgi:hypothetical protein